MLKNRYQEVLVGLNLCSLIRGIISRKNKRSTLLIDDPRFKGESYPGLFLSELEITALSRLGKTFEIPELESLRDFLAPARIELSLGKRRLRLGLRPLANLQELLRKFPELLDPADLDEVFRETDESFERHFFEELRRYERLCFEASFLPKGLRFELQGPRWLKVVYQRLGEKLNADYATAGDLKYQALLHLLSVAFEEKMKTRIHGSELPFYFFRMLSPLFRLQDFFLTTQLKRRLSLLGGDFKESPVQYWQLHENRFDNLLLESFEGVISGERVLFFSHLPEDVPFRVDSPYAIFRKTQVVPGKRRSHPFPPTRITLIADEEYLGGEKPYRVLIAHDDAPASYDWPYPEQPGSKAGFYERESWQMFELDSRTLPFDLKEGVFQPGPGVTLDLRPLREVRKSEATILGRLPLEVVSAERPVQGFEYWGPFRYRAHGILALYYGIEGI